MVNGAKDNRIQYLEVVHISIVNVKSYIPRQAEFPSQRRGR